MNKPLHEFRKDGIGGSDANVIMGVSPWKTLHDLWIEKVTGVEKDSNNYATKKGIKNEEPARQDFERILGVVVAPDQWISPHRPWFRGNVDGIDLEGKILVELKNPKKEDHNCALNKKVPEKYYPQCQHYIKLANDIGYDIEGMYYSSFYNGSSAIVEVPRDDKYIENLLEEEKKFWEMVITNTEVEKDYLCMENNKEWQSFAEQLYRIRKEIKALEEKDDQIIGHLKSLTQGHDGKGHGMILNKQDCKGRIDYSKVPQLEGVDLEEFRKKSFIKWQARFI